MDRQIQVDAVYTDFSKAFDTVNHRVLIEKLRQSGVRGSMLNWLTSYIIGRQQFVKVGNQISRPINVQSSVAQGSHLGPLLFVIFINEISDIFDGVEHDEYADDLKFSRPIHSVADCVILQENIDRLQVFCANHQMQLNVQKCKVISFTKNTVRRIHHTYNINGVSLERVSVMKDLGVLLDSKLSESPHIDATFSSCIKLIGFIMRTGKDFKDPKTLILLFNSLVRSKLEYASPIWSPSQIGDFNMIEKVQRKFVKQLFYRKLIPNATDWEYLACCELLRVETLEKRRVKNGLTFILKAIHNVADGQRFLHWLKINNANQQTRAPRSFKIAKSRTNIGLHSPINTLMSQLNHFCAELDVFGGDLNCLVATMKTNVDLLYSSNNF